MTITETHLELASEADQVDRFGFQPMTVVGGKNGPMSQVLDAQLFADRVKKAHHGRGRTCA